jgi:hypothetical protein
VRRGSQAGGHWGVMKHDEDGMTDFAYQVWTKYGNVPLTLVYLKKIILLVVLLLSVTSYNACSSAARVNRCHHVLEKK